MREETRTSAARRPLRGLLALLLLISLAACGSEEPQADGSRSTEQTENTESSAGAESETAESQSAHSEVSAEGIRMSWSVKGEQISLTLQAPTEGWVAVGFNPSRMMKDANLIIGYVQDGEAYIRDDFGNWFTSHDSDANLGGSDDVSEIEGSEQDGSTTISCSIPLDSGDQYDQPITPGEEMEIILAYGKKDDFTSIHSRVAKTTVRF
jgi:predicted small lipoprotein YifL